MMDNRSTLIPLLCVRSVCGTVEKQRDLHLLRLHFHSLRPLLGFVHPSGSGESPPRAPGSCSGQQSKLLKWGTADFWSDLTSSQKSSEEVTLKDCLRLFTKEDVLDGDESPVRTLKRHHPPRHQRPPYWWWLLSSRCAADVKADGSAPNASASRGSLRSSCCVCSPETWNTSPVRTTAALPWLVFSPPSDLKRFSDPSVRTSKLSTYVNFPLKELEMREFATTGGGEWLLQAEVGLTPAAGDQACLFRLLQSALPTICMLCPTTLETPWEAIIQRTVSTPHWASGTATTTPGIRHVIYVGFQKHRCDLTLKPRGPGAPGSRIACCDGRCD